MRIVVLFLALLVSTAVGVVLLLSMTGGPETPAVEQAPAGQPDDGAVVPFLIHEGQSTEEIAQELERAGLVNNSLVFRVMARLRGCGRKLQAGEYQLRRNMSVDELLVVLQHAPVKEVTITFIEGWRMEEFAAELQGRQLLDGAAFLALAREGPLSIRGCARALTTHRWRAISFPAPTGSPSRQRRKSCWTGCCRSSGRCSRR